MNAGGLGILAGDGQLPGLEQIIEMYYSHTLSATSRLTYLGAASTPHSNPLFGFAAR